MKEEKHVDREKKGSEREKWQYKSALSFSGKNVLLLCLEIWAVLGDRREREDFLWKKWTNNRLRKFSWPQSVTSITEGGFYLRLSSLLRPDYTWMRILDGRTLLLSFPRRRLLLSFDALFRDGMLAKAYVGSCELTHWPAVCAWPCTFAAARAGPLGSFSF